MELLMPNTMRSTIIDRVVRSPFVVLSSPVAACKATTKWWATSCQVPDTYLKAHKTRTIFVGARA